MGKKKLMIVDDEKLICWTLSQTFTKEGYDVVCYNSAEQALEGMQEEEVKAMILDMRLPGISGLDMLATVSQRYPKTRVLMITAYETEEIRNKAEALGALGVFSKPLSLVGLKHMVAKAFQA